VRKLQNFQNLKFKFNDLSLKFKLNAFKIVKFELTLLNVETLN